MNEGATLVGTSNEDMIEFMRYIRERGGECVCTNYEHKVIEVIRGTYYEGKTDRFTMDGVLGVVDPDGADPGEATE